MHERPRHYPPNFRFYTGFFLVGGLAQVGFGVYRVITDSWSAASFWLIFGIGWLILWVRAASTGHT